MKHTSAESFNLSAVHVIVCSVGSSIDEDHKCLERKGFEDYTEEDFCLDYIKKENVFSTSGKSQIWAQDTEVPVVCYPLY